MPILVDPDQVLNDKKKRLPASEIIAILLYPVILLVGVAVGIVIGVREAPSFLANKNAKKYANIKIITNVNTNKNKNTNTAVNSNSNTSILNTNIFYAGDSAKIDAATVAKLEAAKQADLNTVVDKTADFADILRQQDLIDLKYSLLSYKAVRGNYPSTDGKIIRLERNAEDIFYTAMKDFYGGTFYEKIDPQSPQYYYGYTSDGQTFQLSAYLVSKKKAFYLNSSDTQ